MRKHINNANACCRSAHLLNEIQLNIEVKYKCRKFPKRFRLLCQSEIEIVQFSETRLRQIESDADEFPAVASRNQATIEHNQCDF